MSSKSFILSTISISALLLMSACGQPTAAPDPKASAEAASGAEAKADASEEAGGTLTATPQGSVAAGSPVTVLIEAKDKDGTPATNKEEAHIMLVDAGLEDFLHTSAKPGPQAGQWLVTFTPKFARTYKVYAEVGGHGEQGHHDHDEAKGGHSNGSDGGHEDQGDHHGAPPLAASFVVGKDTTPALVAQESLTAEVDGLVFALSLAGPVKVGGHTALSIAVTEKATAKPFLNLEPNLGLYGHLLAFPADGSGMVEGHGENDAPKASTDRGGPVLNYEVDVNQPGPMRLFLQVQHKGKLLAVPFTLVAN